MSHNSKTRQALPDGWIPTKIEIYKQDAIVSWHRISPNGSGGKREPCGDWSRHSRRRLQFYAANTSVEFRNMLTLTYPNIETDGKLVKKHLNHFLTRCRQRLESFSYLWFLEWQKRGSPHFHILTPQFIPYDWVAAEWYRIVDSGNPDHLAAGTRVEALREKDGGKRYAVKYASKTFQKEAPEEYHNVGRLWGCSRDVKPDPPTVLDVRPGDLAALLADWKPGAILAETPLSVLYGAGKHIRDHFGQYID